MISKKGMKLLDEAENVLCKLIAIHEVSHGYGKK